jgi:TadE-like protein
MLRSRQGGQSVVEFGIIAILFTLLMFAVVDFGLLLNSWLTLSSATRDVARAAAVGATASDVAPNGNQLQHMLESVSLTAVSRDLPVVDGAHFSAYAGKCCLDGPAWPWPQPTAAIVLNVAYYGSCIPDPSNPGACPAADYSQVDNWYWGGSCSHPCSLATWYPQRGNTIVVTVVARGATVLTPLVRPFFQCDGASPRCFVRLASTTMMRYEGQ